jgi:hypothetical protein
MTNTTDRSLLKQYADQAEANDDNYVADIVAAAADDELAIVELLLVAAGVPRTYDLDPERAVALRDQLTQELARLALPADSGP